MCDFFVCVWNISGTAERICAKFTGKTCLVLARTSLRSRSISATCVRLMFRKHLCSGFNLVLHTRTKAPLLFIFFIICIPFICYKSFTAAWANRGLSPYPYTLVNSANDRPWAEVESRRSTVDKLAGSSGKYNDNGKTAPTSCAA